MEQEYKWRIDGAAAFDAMARHVSVEPLIRSSEHIDMEAMYYDSTHGLIGRLRGGLRLRRENGKGVCCLKLAARSTDGGTCKTREEFECTASDIHSGIAALPQVGAPADICQALLADGIAELGFTRFMRQAYLLDTGRCTAELAFDLGTLGRGEKTAPICEVELELKSGDAAAFMELGHALAHTFSLVGLPTSKLGRMLAL